MAIIIQRVIEDFRSLFSWLQKTWLFLVILFEAPWIPITSPTFGVGAHGFVVDFLKTLQQ